MNRAKTNPHAQQSLVFPGIILTVVQREGPISSYRIVSKYMDNDVKDNWLLYGVITLGCPFILGIDDGPSVLSRLIQPPTFARVHINFAKENSGSCSRSTLS